MGSFPTGGINGNATSDVARCAAGGCYVGIFMDTTTTDQKISCLMITTSSGAITGLIGGGIAGNPCGGLLIGASVGLATGLTVIAINEICRRNL